LQPIPNDSISENLASENLCAHFKRTLPIHTTTELTVQTAQQRITQPGLPGPSEQKMPNHLHKNAKSLQKMPNKLNAVGFDNSR